MSVMISIPTNRAERRKQQTIERLINAARELYLVYGYHDLTIKAITDRADLGYGTFYLYFNDKDDIVWAVIHEAAETFRVLIDQRLEQIAFPMREYLSWIAIFRFTLRYREHFIAVYGEQGSAKLTQYYQAYLAQIHEDNMQRGTYTANLDVPPAFMAQFMTGALFRLLLWWLQTPNEYTAEQMALLVFQAIFRQPPPEPMPEGFWDELF